MKLGDIKIESIKLMFANYSFDFGIGDLPNMAGDENYGSYIVSMNGSIARALDRLQDALVLPVKSREIKAEELTDAGRCSVIFDISKIKDLYLIDRITATDKYGDYIANAEYLLDGDSLRLLKGFEYTVLYYPKATAVDDSVGDGDDIGIPDHIARLIPYYVKGELYQEEEPSLAADARNTFEQSLDDLKRQSQSNQTRVARVLHL